MRILALAIAALSLFCLPAFHPALAHSFQTGDIKIGHPWARPTESGATSTEVYMAFLNTGKDDDQLQSATTSVAQKITLQDGGNNVNAIDLPPGKGISLLPGRSALKLDGLKGGFAAGDRFTVRLTFAKSPPVDVVVFVEEDHSH